MARHAAPTVSAKRRLLARLLQGDRLGLQRAVRAGVTPRRDGIALMVYSRTSSAVVTRFVRDAERAGWEARLWALDEPAPGLRGHTVGSGRGSRYELLNRLHATVGNADLPVVLVDDDVEFAHGSLSMLAGIGWRCSLDVYQPAQTYDSVVSFRLSYRRPATVARRTNWAEEGPLTLLEPRARERLLPLDESVPQAGGMDFSWRRQHPDLRFGIVDAVTFRHLRPLGQTYARRESFEALEVELARAGFHGHPKHAVRTLASWRAWQSEPSW